LKKERYFGKKEDCKGEVVSALAHKNSNNLFNRRLGGNDGKKHTKAKPILVS